MKKVVAWFAALVIFGDRANGPPALANNANNGNGNGNNGGGNGGPGPGPNNHGQGNNSIDQIQSER